MQYKYRLNELLIQQHGTARYQAKLLLASMCGCNVNTINSECGRKLGDKKPIPKKRLDIYCRFFNTTPEQLKTTPSHDTKTV